MKRKLSAIVFCVGVFGSVASLPPIPEDGDGAGLGSDGVAYPVELLGAALTELSTGDPEVAISYRNVGEVALDEVQFRVEFFDENEPVEQFGSGDTAVRLVVSDDLLAAGEHTGILQAFGWEFTNKVVVTHSEASLDGGEEPLICDDDDECPRVLACNAGEASCDDPGTPD